MIHAPLLVATAWLNCDLGTHHLAITIAVHISPTDLSLRSLWSLVDINIISFFLSQCCYVLWFCECVCSMYFDLTKSPHLLNPLKMDVHGLLTQ